MVLPRVVARRGCSQRRRNWRGRENLWYRSATGLERREHCASKAEWNIQKAVAAGSTGPSRWAAWTGAVVSHMSEHTISASTTPVRRDSEELRLRSEATGDPRRPAGWTRESSLATRLAILMRASGGHRKRCQSSWVV